MHPATFTKCKTRNNENTFVSPHTTATRGVYEHIASPKFFVLFFNTCCSNTGEIKSLEVLLDILLVCFPVLLFDL